MEAERSCLKKAKGPVNKFCLDNLRQKKQPHEKAFEKDNKQIYVYSNYWADKSHLWF